MEEYLREIKRVCEQLASIGSPVSEQMKIFAALKSLGREYEHIKTSVEGSMDTQPTLTFEVVIPRLTSYSDRLTSYNSSGNSEVSPHLAFNTFRTDSSGYYHTNNRGRGARGGNRAEALSPHVEGGFTNKYHQFKIILVDFNSTVMIFPERITGNTSDSQNTAEEVPIPLSSLQEFPPLPSLRVSQTPGNTLSRVSTKREETSFECTADSDSVRIGNSLSFSPSRTDTHEVVTDSSSSNSESPSPSTTPAPALQENNSCQTLVSSLSSQATAKTVTSTSTPTIAAVNNTPISISPVAVAETEDLTTSASSSPVDFVPSFSPTVIQTEAAPKSTVKSTHKMVTRLKDGIRKPNPRYVLLTHKVDIPEPKTVTEALKHPGWNGAMNEEYGNCKAANNWSLTPPTPDMHVLGSKWVFRTKLNSDGTLQKLKARLVAQGYDQEEGIDYMETYSPVVRTATVRSVLHFATVMRWDIKQMDVQNAFLHGDLTETVYMKQPTGFVDPSKPEHVCLLHKSIYDLKQSPRAWFDKFSTYLFEFGFTCCIPDPSLFVYMKGNAIILLLLYVDDMLITGNSSEALTSLLTALNSQFHMKDLGQMQYFLGIQAQFHPAGLFLSQQKYAEDLLVTAGMSECALVATPLPEQLEKTREKHKELFTSPTYFRSLAGKLQYPTLTRPDIQFTVNYVCQKMHAPTLADFYLLKRILRYIKGTVTMGINFSNASTSIIHQSSTAITSPPYTCLQIQRFTKRLRIF
ncbi:PREDICTED: uncharacterized protein LOC104720600 [Camelina sativa]|uniref:Uncharacterized protein LOC104720600 n=1 Tax=Camelina sativa TaxID=90675 RepID=A0ABM0U6R6_CAMSA|nr:PREDICTED: uncharacterized protein LOC104720600 [Camelina sativa]